jgi:hypothetical protein
MADTKIARAIERSKGYRRSGELTMLTGGTPPVVAIKKKREGSFRVNLEIIKPINRKEPLAMKDSTKTMNILETYDLYQSYNQAARACCCSPNTVRSLVKARNEGTLGRRGERTVTSSLFHDDHLMLISSLVEVSEGAIRADVVHRRLKSIGFAGSERSTRRAVHKEKARYRQIHSRVYWPWIPEPGKWAQYDFSDGPVINGVKTTLFHYYLPYSKYRIVRYIPDQSLPNVMAALDTCFRMTGGIPQYVLTDNPKTASVDHICGVSVLNAQMVKFAAAYGFTLTTCIPYDPASKGGVERSVRVAKEHLCPTKTNLLDAYPSIAKLKEAIDAYSLEINAKVHAGSGKIPDLSLREERGLFSGLPVTPYVAAYGITRRVEANMPIVRYRHCGYSVPPHLRGSIVHVREVGDEVVIVSATSTTVSEVARHKRGEPYGYVISDDHKDPSHPSGPLMRHPVATNDKEARFLAIAPVASTWLERAANMGAKGIRSSISSLLSANPRHAELVMDTSLYANEFANEFIVKLLCNEQRMADLPYKISPASIGGSTAPYAQLLEVSHDRN